MKLVLFGGPGAGKGTQAAELAQHYNISHISTGDILRQERDNNTPLGLKAKEYMNAGKLVPDDLIIDMVKNRVAMDDCKSGYILDGFPRTVPQAGAMEKAGIEVDIVVSLELPDEVMAERILGRAMETRAAGLKVRDDDLDPEIIAQRIRTFHEETDPVKSFYEAKNLVASVISDTTISEMTKKVITAISEFFKANSDR